MSSELPIPDKALNVLILSLTLPDVTSEEEAMIKRPLARTQRL